MLQIDIIDKKSRKNVTNEPLRQKTFFRTAKDATFLHVVNKDSDQTARMRKLVLVIVECMSEGTSSYVTIQLYITKTRLFK